MMKLTLLLNHKPAHGSRLLVQRVDLSGGARLFMFVHDCPEDGTVMLSLDQAAWDALAAIFAPQDVNYAD